MSAAGNRFSDRIRCPKCGQKGETIWQRTSSDNELVEIVGSFFERISKKAPYNIELVCVLCNAAQPE